MANKDLRAFLEDLMLRYDPGVDLSDQSRAQTAIIEPIMQRLGLDPIDEELYTFLITRVRQAYPELGVTGVDDLGDLMIDPMRALMEPLVREVKLLRLRGSIANVESLSDDEVDALLGNFFSARNSGGYSNGVVRIYYTSPQSVSISFLHYATSKSGLKYLPSAPQAITSDQMFLNVEGSQYYFDVLYRSENRGDQYNVEPNEITTVANLTGYATVRNIRKFRDGQPREDSIAYAARVQSSQGDSTLNTPPGIIDRYSKAFPALRRLYSVGYRDPEMQRDIVTGGGYSTFLPDDAFGPLRGSEGDVEDDGDDDFTSPILHDPEGHFVARLGATGAANGWYVTLIYEDGPNDVFAEVAILSVVDDTRIIVAHEMPSIPTPVTGVRWILRRRELSISNIPGGIALPTGPNGTLVIAPDEVHIGGKIDVYAAGPIDEGSARIDALGDESPYAAGVDARTDGGGASPREVLLFDIDGDLTAGIAAGMSLVLDEGSDVGSYRIRQVVSTSPCIVELDTEMTAAQVGLIWRIVDVIDVTLTDPRSPKLAGSDLVLSAGSPIALTSGGANFLDAGVQKGDTLEVLGGPMAGLYDVQTVAATSLEIFPSPVLSQSSVAYSIFHRSQAVDAPVVRIKSMDVLDAAGAPTGSTIPYRHPVLVESRAFQNESSALLFDSTVILGLVSDPISGTVSGTLDLDFRDRDGVWGPAALSHSDSWVSVPLSTIVTDLNTDLPGELFARAVGGRLYITGVRHITVSGSLGTVLGWQEGYTNASLRAQNARDNFGTLGVREGDVVEVVTGSQANTRTRVAAILPADVTSKPALVAAGPTAAHEPTTFNPAIDVQARIGRPSVGSARAYFLAPTTAEFPYQTARFVSATGLEYRPDPTNTRVLYPAPPTTKLPATASTAGTAVLTDTEADFVTLGVREGDQLELLYIPIVGDVALAAPPATLTLAGLTLRLRLGAGPWITISFPTDMNRTEAVNYVNTRLGEIVADLTGTNHFRLQSDKAIEVDPASTAFSALLGTITTYNSDHPDLGKYVVTGVTATQLTSAGATFDASTLLRYRVLRYTQRSSTTETALRQDASGLYYFDVELVSTAPGNQYNIAAQLSLEPSGYRSEGYELEAANTVLTYSRAEVLRARISRSILLDGSPDSDDERLQLSGLNVLVSYDRSQLIEDMQGFADANFTRVLNAEVLVRHLLPHYVRATWKYVGGASELENKRALETLLEEIEAGEELEVLDLAAELTKRGATSVYAEDPDSATGRSAPLLVIVYHAEDRRIRALIVRDFVDTVRTQRFIAEAISLTRASTGGIR